MLPLEFCNAVQEKIDTQIVEIAKLREQLATKSGELSQMSTSHVKLNDDISPVKL